MTTVDSLVDAFVEKINDSERELGWPGEVPPSLRLGPPDGGGEYDWRIQRWDGIDWVAATEAILPGPLPPSFRSLVTRYVYPCMNVSGLMFLANAVEQTQYDWRTALWADKSLSPSLMREGYVQFAQPDTGSYDPICFDTRNRDRDGECPIVWIDHEGILCDDKIAVYKNVAPSFVEFVHEYLAGGKP